MATGQLIDVAADENGYDFVRDDGSSVYLLRTPETDELANQISQVRSAGMLAEAPSNDANMATDAGMSMAPPPEMVASPNPGSVDFGNAPLPGDPGMAPAPGPVAAPGAPPAAPGVPGAPAGMDPMQLAVLAARRPGTPGVTQAQLQEKATQGVEMPSGTETVVEGAIPYDEELAGQRAMATDMGREAHANQNIDARLAAQEEADAQLELAQRIEQGTGPARAKLQDLERSVEGDARHYRSLRSQVASGKVDPGRLFRGPAGTVAGIAAVIGNAMGAYGAILGRSNNFAQEMIQSAIDRDVQAQVDEFNRLGDAADNMYRDLMQQYQDRDMARAALEGMQQEYGKALAAHRVAKSKDAQLQNGFQEWLAGDMFKEAELERTIREKSVGKHTERIKSDIAYPVKARGGGIDYGKLFGYTMQMNNQQRENALAQATIEEKQSGSQKNMALAEKAQAEATGGSQQDRSEYNKSARSVDSAMTDIEAIAKSHGYEIDPKTGKFTQTGAGFPLDLPDPTFGVLGDTAETTKLQSDLTAMGVAFGRVVNDGGEPSADLARRLIPSYGSSSAPNDLVAQLESAYQGLQRKKASIGAGASAATRGQRVQQQRAVNVERAGMAPLPEPEEF